LIFNFPVELVSIKLPTKPHLLKKLLIISVPGDDDDDRTDKVFGLAITLFV